MKQDFEEAGGVPTPLQQKLTEALQAIEALDQAATQSHSDPHLKSAIALLRRKKEILAKVEESVLQHLLPVQLKIVGGWSENLDDPEMPQAGRRIAEALRECGCVEKTDVRQPQTAVYTSFSLLAAAYGFLNHIVYGAHAVESEEKLFSARNHETMHALQKRKSAGLHASPFNPDTKILVCPRDWLLLQEKCEEDANVKQAWLNSLLAKENEKIISTSERDVVSAMEFATARANCGNLETAIREYARVSLGKAFYLDNHSYLFANHYQDYSLNGYRDAMNTRKSRGEFNFIFVRAEPEDVIAIGQSFGPSSYGDNPFAPGLMHGHALNVETEERLQALNRKLGITDEAALPTLSQVLATMGMSRQDFIDKTFGRNSSRLTGPIGPRLSP